jgi:hypothetical protein
MEWTGCHLHSLPVIISFTSFVFPSLYRLLSRISWSRFVSVRYRLAVPSPPCRLRLRCYECWIQLSPFAELWASVYVYVLSKSFSNFIDFPVLYGLSMHEDWSMLLGEPGLFLLRTCPVTIDIWQDYGSWVICATWLGSRYSAGEILLECFIFRSQTPIIYLCQLIAIRNGSSFSIQGGVYFPLSWIHRV